VRPLFWIIFTLGLAGILVGLVGIGVAATQGTGRINVTATLAHASSREVGRPGTQSNASEQSWRVTDSHGRTIGRMLMQCRWITPRARLCQAEVELPRGKIVAVGSSTTPFEGEYAVTGGTGRYQGGGGVMTFTAIGLRKQILLITITT